MANRQPGPLAEVDECLDNLEEYAKRRGLSPNTIVSRALSNSRAIPQMRAVKARLAAKITTLREYMAANPGDEQNTADKAEPGSGQPRPRR